MTNNQREFQKQINRLQREMNQLSRSNFELPKQPKRITKRDIEKIKSLHATDIPDTIPTPKSQTTKAKQPSTIRGGVKAKYQHHPRVSTAPEYIAHPRVKHEPSKDKPVTVKKKSWLDEQEPKQRKTRSDKGIKRGTSPLKGRPSSQKGKSSPLKGTKLTEQEKAKRNAKRIETLSKSNKPRKTRKDKGTHLTAEERARRNAKRQETIRKKKERTPIDGLDFAPNNTAPDKPYNMIERILELIDEAESKCHDQHQIHKYAKTWDGFERMSYLVMLRMLVSSNYESASYYDSIASRENEIAQLLNNIALYRPEDIDDDTPPLDPNTSYNRLYELLTPDGSIDMETNKEVTEANEQYVWELLG